jgi:UDP-glucose 4-epimerase
MKALVIGGNGFIGTHLVDVLLAANHKVKVLDLYPSRYREPYPNVEYVVGDLGNHGEMHDAVQGMDWVFHLAYATLPQTSNEDPTYDVRSNVLNSLQLLEECRNSSVQKIIFISSGGTVYGVPKQTPIPEDHPTDPICSYGITKLTIEKYLALYQKIWDLEYVVCRVSNPYGPLQNPFAKQGAISVFLGNVMQNKPITIWGTGEVVRDYIYIEDTAKALLQAAEYKSDADSPRIFNIGGGHGTSLNQIVQEIKQIAGPKIEVKYTPARALDVPANVLDITRAKKYLNWAPETELGEGLRRTWDWINKHARVAIIAQPG